MQEYRLGHLSYRRTGHLTDALCADIVYTRYDLTWLVYQDDHGVLHPQQIQETAENLRIGKEED